MLRYYYASLALSISRIQLTFSLCLFFHLPSILKSVFVCLCCFLFTTFGLSAYPYDDTQPISHDHRVLLLINIRIIFVFLLLSVSA